MGREEGCFVISVKLSGRAHFEMSSREPFLESAHLCHRLQNQLCMPASVLLEGPASSDSPRSLPNRLPLRGNEQSLPRQGCIRSSRLAADPTDPHPRSNSPVKCSSTWDCIPALPLKSCGGLGQITRLSPLPPVNGIISPGYYPTGLACREASGR